MAWLRREKLVQGKSVVDFVGEVLEELAELGLEQWLQLRGYVPPVVVEEDIHCITCK
jgi:hypothetical protein